MDINQNQMFLGKFLFIIFFCFSLTALSQGSDYSLAFEKANTQYVTAPSISSTFGTGTNDLTVECYVLVDNQDNTGGLVSSYTTVSGGWALHISGGKIDFIVGKRSGTNYWDRVTYGNKLKTGQWYHVAGVKKGANIMLYINGVLIGQKTADSLFTTTTNVVLGNRYTNTLDYLLDGQLDEVRIWDHALDVKEIRTWMCKKLTSSHPNYSKLVRYYNLNTGSGTTVIDNIGSNNGTFVNSPSWETSGAPIGDESTYEYSSNINTFLSHASGERITVNSSSPSIAGVHIYRVDQAPNTMAGILQIPNTTKYFGVFKAGDNNSAYSLTYYYDGNPGVSLINEPELGLYERLHNATPLWTDAFSTLDMPSKSIKHTTSKNTEIILGKVILPLPIELISFDVSNQTNLDVQIEWATASETNNDYFTIERSADGKNWREVHKVKGAGYSTNILNYTSTDEDRLFGISYYRLKQTDFDGATTYSQTKSISLENLNQSELDIYPNPFKNEFNVKGSKSTLEQVRIFSSTGRDVTGFATLTTINDSFVRFDLSQLSSGLYFVITETTSNKIIKY